MDLMGWLDSATHTLFRFEYLQDFSATDAVLFDRWQKTGAIDTTKMQEWWNFLEKKHHEGVLTQRVRRVMTPLSPYVQFELEAHRMTAMHNDDIRIITEDKFAPLGLPAADYWIIDDTTVVKMNYGNKGEFVGIERQDFIQQYIRAKNILLSYSMPLNMFEEK